MKLDIDEIIELDKSSFLKIVTNTRSVVKMGAILLKQNNKVLESRIINFFRSIFGTKSEKKLCPESLFILGWIGNDDAIELLVSCLKSGEPKIQAGAGFVLAQIDEISFLDLLLPLLNDRSTIVRGWVAFSIGWCGGNYHLEALRNHPYATHKRFKNEMIEILKMIGTREALEFRTSLLQ
jgi:HEAT repeat protein